MGVCPFIRTAEYSNIGKHDYFRKANEETMVIIHIEGAEGVSNIDEILSVDGIDIIFLGPYDLSQSLGVPGQVDHPKVIETMEEVVAKAKEKGKVVGVFVDDAKIAYKWIDLGVKYISYSADTGIIFKCCKDIVKQFK